MGNTNGVKLEETEVPELDNLLKVDGYLTPYQTEIRRRYGCFQGYMSKINQYEHGLLNFTESYKRYGMHVDENNNMTVLEWAPGAKNLFLRGDFSKSRILTFMSYLYIYKSLYYLNV